MLCGLACCYGFAHNSILAVFASKIGYPIGVTACAISINKKSIYSVIWYAILLVTLGVVYFFLDPLVVDHSIIKNFSPSIFDLIIAVGVGSALSYFWSHPVRLNLVVMCAGVASLLPACIACGYFLSHNELILALASIALYVEYVVGMFVGAWIVNKFESVT